MFSCDIFSYDRYENPYTSRKWVVVVKAVRTSVVRGLARRFFARMPHPLVPHALLPYCVSDIELYICDFFHFHPWFHSHSRKCWSVFLLLDHSSQGQ